MTISASGSSRSKNEVAPSLSEVTTKVWSRPSRNLRSPSPPETEQRSSPGRNRSALASVLSDPPDSVRFSERRREHRLSDIRQPDRRRARTEFSPFLPPSRNPAVAPMPLNRLFRVHDSYAGNFGQLSYGRLDQSVQRHDADEPGRLRVDCPLAVGGPIVALLGRNLPGR